MISIRDVGNYYEVQTKFSNLVDFDRFMGLLKVIPRNKRKPNIFNNTWKIHKDNINILTESYPDIIYITNPYDSIGSTMKLTPYHYQKESIHFALNNPSSLIILPCGSGKTPIGIGLCVELFNQNLIDKNSKCLIVVKASLKYQWSKEIVKFCDLNAKIIETPSKARKKFDSQFGDYNIYILNYETLKNKDVANKLKEEDIQCIYMDEIHYVNSYKSDRSKALAEFNYIKYKIGATATPITNNPENLFGIFNIIQPDLFQNHTKFANNYLKYSGYGRPPKPKNQEHLKTQIKPYMLVKTKDEIADQLPETLSEQIYCEMSPSMRKMNDKIMQELDEQNAIADDLETRLKPYELETSEEFKACKAKSMALQTFAQELVDSPRLLSESTSDMAKQYAIKDESSKLEMCLDLIDSIISSEEKVCIFTKFERMQGILEKAINKKFKDIDIAKINGTLSPEQRYEEAYTKFRDTDSYKVLLGTDAMAEGVNLSQCKYLIEYDLASSHAIQTQRWGRLERADSIHSTVHVYQLIMTDSWDEIQKKIIDKKEGYDNTLIQSLNKD